MKPTRSKGKAQSLPRREKRLRCALEIIGNCYGKVELAIVRQHQLVPIPLCRKHRGER